MVNFSFVLRPSLRQLSLCSTVLNGVAQQYSVDRHQTTLTIKSVERGSARYRTRHGQFLVDPEHFLILNHGREYALDFEGPGTTETVCPFFQHGFVEHVAHSLTSCPDLQLENIDAKARAATFVERLYPKQHRIGRLLSRLKRNLQTPSADCALFEDNMYSLAEAMVLLDRQVHDEMGKVPARRASTREELYRRLHRARDFVASCYASKITVETAAKVAHLSPYHFHRAFRSVFGQTPMQYLQQRRLAAAQRLLAETEEPVSSICLAVGFESIGSFGWLFKTQQGCSPRAFRERLRRSRRK